MGETAASAADTQATSGAEWWRWLALLPVLGAIVWSRITWLDAFKAQLTNPPSGSSGERVELPLAQLRMTEPPPARRLARQISWREPGIARRIHGEASVRATIRRGGFLTVVPRRRRRSADFVFLVPRRRKSDHERDRVSRFIEGLRRGGLSLDAYDYDPDPRRLYPQRATGRAAWLDLRALRELHPEARLVLVTDGSELVDYFTQQPLPFVAAELAAWPSRMLLTPLPMEEWGEREMGLADALDALVGRATPEGFRDLALAFGERVVKPPRPVPGRNTGSDEKVWRWLDAMLTLLGRPMDERSQRPEAVRFGDPRLISEAVPPQAYRDQLVEELHGWMGRRGFEWLCACAAYPELRFAVTLYLGLNLRTQQGLISVPLYDELLLSRLTLLPWFRVGRMPRWLRLALFGELDEAGRQRVRQVVAGMLQLDTSAAARDLPEEARLPIWRLSTGGIRMQPDAVMADLLFKQMSDVDPVLRDGAFSEVFAGARRRVRNQHVAIIAVVALWSGLAFLFWPELGAPPYATGIWLPLVGLVLGTVLAAALLWSGGVWGPLRRRQAVAA